MASALSGTMPLCYSRVGLTNMQTQSPLCVCWPNLPFVAVGVFCFSDGVGGLSAGQSEVWLCFEVATGNINVASFELIPGGMVAAILYMTLT